MVRIEVLEDGEQVIDDFQPFYKSSRQIFSYKKALLYSYTGHVTQVKGPKRVI
jgi:hypothetical protein